MDDLISRQAAIEKTDMLFKALSKDYVDMMGIGYNHAVADAIATLKCLPSAERHGKWLMIDKGHHFYDWECSICGRSGRGDYAFCPNCGAKMDEVTE